MITIIGANICRYMWQHNNQYKDCFVGIDDFSKPIEILSHGIVYEDNDDLFVSAKVIVESVTYSGTVMMHSSPEMYNKWNNSIDSKTHTVSVHVVGLLDTQRMPNIYSAKSGITIIAIIPEPLYKKYFAISNSGKRICGSYYCSLPSFSKAHLIDTVFIERLNNKCKHLENHYRTSGNNWLNTLMFAIFDSIQISTRNRKQFNILLKEIKHYMIIQSINTIDSMEALLLGTAGLLTSDYPDEYLYKLRKEYDRLYRLHGMKTLNSYRWDTSSANVTSIYTLFAQLSAVIFQNKTLMYDLIESNSIKQIESFFSKDVSEYWLKHYEFGVQERKEVKHKRLSSQKINTILINGVLPFIALYSKLENLPHNDMDRIIGYYMSIESENNKFTKEWEQCGVDINTALDSQSFIEISKNYCMVNKCWKCGLGKKMLSTQSNNVQE